MEQAEGASGRNPFNALEDGLLVHILCHLTPLPDLFNARAACKRFRRVSYDQRLYLHVMDARERPRSGLEDKCFASLELAVAASRPGDTVRVHPGRHVTSNVSLKWPLQITGAAAAGGAVLFAPRGADAAISAFSTLRLADLVITAELGACVQHSAGNVLIERCTLQCADHPLEHLVTPIVSLVAPKTATAALESVLSVAETKLEGGAGAVRCLGSGVVQSTRTIYFSRTTPFFWFRVVGDPTRSVAHVADPKGKALAEPTSAPSAVGKAGPFLYGGATLLSESATDASAAGEAHSPSPAGEASSSQAAGRSRAAAAAAQEAPESAASASSVGGGIVRSVARTRLLAPGHKRGGHHASGPAAAGDEQRQAQRPVRRRLHQDRVNGLLGEDDGETAMWGWGSEGEEDGAMAAGGGGSVMVGGSFMWGEEDDAAACVVGAGRRRRRRKQGGAGSSGGGDAAAAACSSWR